MDKIIIYYDAVCPSCQRDQQWFNHVIDKNKIEWCDINENKEALLKAGINPKEALTSLHIQLADGAIVNDIDAYIALLKLSPWLRVIAWVMNFKMIKHYLHIIYQKSVHERLKKSNRLP
ncbi:DUF393 domain-containing protein [Endozoicomonas sp. SM1973]|uniref:DUF393 domain-containing protein n=1 Tax=Spartinivicinus marinus TaxID=2994442 RepID=A0A853I3Q5_9GAMM|nr:DUF393 domain-containing protein [Spartinivicinus marinus]MCX4026757.1 DUF393 domain-containing protein [Spartinivicinus marinus]NYZ64591.1 DUF393 domain-containing protein [Spartinivicinus marinus]